MRTIGVVTVARSDYGIYQPILRRITTEAQMRLKMFVGGMHLSPEFGRTVSSVEADGYEIAERVEMLLSSDTPGGIAKSMGLGVVGFAQVFARERPDILVVLGDRFEMHAAALAALPFNIPIAHIHGGEVTYGAMDDALRHAITKLSHLHFVATEDYARRVRQLGEEPWRITVTGAPSLDSLKMVRTLSRADLEADLGFALRDAFMLVTYHPVSLEYEKAEWQCAEMLKAIESIALQAIFTLPNADTAGRSLGRLVREFVRSHRETHLVENLGTGLYFNLMRCASVMVGNSSSGIIEAASFGLPVVNIGSRQAGRVRGANVIDVADGTANVQNGIRRALVPGFRSELSERSNPYWAGREASGIIVEKLRSAELDHHLIEKRFHDWRQPQDSVVCA